MNGGGGVHRWTFSDFNIMSGYCKLRGRSTSNRSKKRLCAKQRPSRPSPRKLPRCAHRGEPERPTSIYCRAGIQSHSSSLDMGLDGRKLDINIDDDKGGP